MSIQIKKIESDETGPFTKDKNVIHVHQEPDLGIIDAHNSEIVLQMNADTNDLLPWVFAEGQGASAAGQTLTPAALVRNYHLTSTTVGTVLTSNGLTNRVNENINRYKLSTAQAEAKSLFQANSNRNQGRWYKNGVPQSPFLLASRPTESDVEFTTPSQLRTAEIRIPLRDLHPFYQGKTKMPALGMGRLMHEFRLEDVVPVLALPQLPREEDCEDVANATMGDSADPTAAGAIVLSAAYQLDQITYWVGAPVRLTWTDGGGAKADNGVISALYHDSATDTVGIALETPLAVAGGNATNVTIRIRSVELEASGASGNDAAENYGQAVAVADWSIDHFQLEVHRYILNPTGLNQILSSLNNKLLSFTDYVVQDDTLTPTKNYQYTIGSIPRGAFAVAVLTPYGTTRGLLSTRNHADRYQFSIDGITTTNRDVQIGASDDANNKTLAAGRGLHYDRLQQFFNAIGTPLMRFDGLRFNYLQGADRQTPDYLIYPQLIPQFNDDMNHQLTFDLYSDGDNMNQTTVHYVFFVRRALRVQDGEVTNVMTL